ncbi:Lipopolysaccharide biosynthesis protein, LPS:glycosyltransferase [Pilibacter termitis]|uniref:Lipopolysaccharide biosynthesis protein, LPS:glycosyltransferase n=1 Tax=Pilibacter termitis TaxID=263852 RepID=A0A1T4QZP9_9ENTE|nr:DUF4422 domain-containing protein [Pilibacter termitis]SKA09220.1 Lipopolysaccharide biosynthesis protein, LPS:glycosyltransferase [Pilibacter termitis]
MKFTFILKYNNEKMLSDFRNARIFEGVEFLIPCAEEKRNVKNKFYEIKYVEENLSLLELLKKSTGDYTVIIDNPVRFTSDFVDEFSPSSSLLSKVLSTSKKGLSLLDTAVLWKDGGTTTYKTKIENYEELGKEEFLLAMSDFFAFSAYENKIIGKDLLKVLISEMTESIEEINDCYSFNLLLKETLLENPSFEIEFLNGVFSVIDWKKQDLLLTERLEEGRWFYDFIESLEKFFANVTDEVSSGIVNQLLWRADWAMTPKQIEKLLVFVSDEVEVNNEIPDSQNVDQLIKILPNYLKAKKPEKELDLKIYVSMHKPSFVPENKYLYPIQVGTEIAEKKFDGVLYDNTGENISEKNKRYNEMTAQYWAWKNEKADYYGFWHYRRYFVFNHDTPTTIWGVIPDTKITQKALKKYSITEEEMASMIDGFDLILPEYWNIKYGGDKVEEATVEQHWNHNLNPADLEILKKVIQEKYPAFSLALNQTLSSTKEPFFNMFIMEKELFNEYNEFAFGVLAEVEKALGDDHELYSVEWYRTLGHLGERLVAIFTHYVLENKKQLNVLNLPVVQWSDTTPEAKKIQPAFKTKNIPIVLAYGNEYTKYAAVLLNSIVKNSSVENNYDIIVFHTTITEENQRRIVNEFSQDNISIRYVNVEVNITKHGRLEGNAHISMETYYRYLIPELLMEDKAIYIDSDTVVEQDLAELYEVEIGDNFVGAVRDYDFSASVCFPEKKEIYEKEILQYLNLENDLDYFQAGVLLLNLSAIRERYTIDDFIKKTLSRDWMYNDQDVLNLFFKNKVVYLDSKWNVICLAEPNSMRREIFNKHLPHTMNKVYNDSRKNPAVVHFAGGYKPWEQLNCDMQEYFWKYAKNTSFYAELVNQVQQTTNIQKIIFSTECKDVEKRIPFVSIQGEAFEYGTSICVFQVTELHSHFGSIASEIVIVKFNVYDFEIEYSGSDKLRDNLTFERVSRNVLQINAKYNGQWNGYSLKPLSLQTRSNVVPIVKGLNVNFVRV